MQDIREQIAMQPMKLEVIAQPSPENFISKLLVGYVEQSVSPHTIADVVRSQLIDANLTPDTLSAATCNGIIEVLTSISSTHTSTDILFYFVSRKHFPGFLSTKATLGLILAFLKHAPLLQDKAHSPKLFKLGGVFDNLAQHLNTQNCIDTFSSSERTRVVNAIKLLPDNLRQWLSTAAPNLLNLHSKCANSQTSTQQMPQMISTNSIYPTDVFGMILEMGEHTLVQKGISHFRINPRETEIEWKLNNLFFVLDKASDPNISAFKRSFIIEWYFDSLLRETLRNANFTANLHDCLKIIIENIGLAEGTLKGILRAMQRDICLTATELNYPQNKHPKLDDMIVRCNAFFTNLLSLCLKDINTLSKNFSLWALQLPVHPPEVRLFTRPLWQWMRVISTGQWEDDLRMPPSWILSQANKYSAQVFRIAPNFWLQEYAVYLIEKLHNETLLSDFSPSMQHINYAEFLCRILRKKSPLFASRHELMLALRILGRATPQEDSQLNLFETRLRMQGDKNTNTDPEKIFFFNYLDKSKSADNFGTNILSRALYIMLHTAKLVSKSHTIKSQFSGT